jgi:hypothetical protein
VHLVMPALLQLCSNTTTAVCPADRPVTASEVLCAIPEGSGRGFRNNTPVLEPDCSRQDSETGGSSTCGRRSQRYEQRSSLEHRCTSLSCQQSSRWHSDSQLRPDTHQSLASTDSRRGRTRKRCSSELPPLATAIPVGGAAQYDYHRGRSFRPHPIWRMDWRGGAQMKFHAVDGAVGTVERRLR